MCSVFQVIKHSLKVTRWFTGNQCESRQMSTELTVIDILCHVNLGIKVDHWLLLIISVSSSAAV